MKSKEIISNQRKELADGMKEFIPLFKDNKSPISDKDTIEILYGGLGMIRIMDWILDESDLDFVEYCKNTNESIKTEFDNFI